MIDPHNDQLTESDLVEDYSWETDEAYYSDIKPTRISSEDDVITTGNVSHQKPDLERDIVDNDY